MEIKSLYREIINEHNLHPENKYDLLNANLIKNGVNPTCGDDINLQLVVKNGVIEKASFNGTGCAISQASADIMCNLITGRSLENAKELVVIFNDMIMGRADEDSKEKLDEAAALEDIAHMPARVKCAELSWRTFSEMASELEKNQLSELYFNAEKSGSCEHCKNIGCDNKK
ncbi:MAG: Fe-S cluster assembly sulfur transfer protein SufU [Candidatus Fimenecus sp.]